MGLDEVLGRRPTLLEDFALQFEEVRFAFDPSSWTLVYLDPVFDRLWGGSVDAMYEDFWGAWAERVLPEDRAGIPETPHEMLAGYDHTFRIRRPDGELRWVRVRTRPVEGEADPVDLVLGTMRDVTRRRRTEEELSRSRNQLAEAQWLAGLGSWGWDIPRNRMEWSDHLYHMLGSEPGGFAPTLKDFLRRVHPDDRAVAIEAIKHSVDSGEPLRAEYRMMREDGTTWWVQSTGRLVRDPSGRPSRLEGTALDITDRKRMEWELQDLRRSAEGSDSDKSRFLANLSHEIRTPLGGMIQMARALAENDLPDSAREHADAIEHAGASLLGMVNEFLDWARIEAGRAELEAHDFNPEDILRDIAQLFLPSAREKGIGLSIYLPAELPWRIRGHREAMRRVLSNLVANAVKFTSQGYVSLAVEVHPAGGTQTRIRFVVKDTGIGIGRADQERIFEQFQQANPSISRRFGGTGLGLAISRELVELMDGSIELKSELGEGSTFAFELEVERVGSGQTASDEAERRQLPASLVGRRVLSVSAEARLHGTIVETLGEERVTAASSFAGALSLMEEGRGGDAPDLVIVDPRLGEEAAFEFAAAARRLAGRAELGLVLIRPESENLELGRVVTAGFQATVPFPHRTPEFLLSLGEGLGRMERKVSPSSKPGGSEATTGSKGSAGGSARKEPQRGRVLLAEDSWVNKEALSHALEGMGCEVDAVSTGTEAVSAFRRGSYDVLVVDIQMPGLDGFELTRKVREEEKGRTGDPVPIVGLTGHDGERVAEKALAAGMDECLMKPIDQTGLRAIVDRFLPRLETRDPLPGR